MDRNWLRRLAILLPVIVTAMAVCGPLKAQSFETDLPRALLLDVQTGTVLFETGADESFEPASLTKIMTAEVLFHEISEGRVSPDQQFHVSEYAWRTGGAPSRSTAMFASVNSDIAVSDLMRGLVVPSGNDAAIVLAEGIAGTETAFSLAMNRRAHDIGLKASNFVNASGLEAADQRTTARDLARLAVHVIETYPDLYKVFAEPEFMWNKIRQRNRNPLLTLNIGADGFLTGYTEAAGFSLVGSAVLDGRRLIAVVSGAKTARDRDQEARKLLDWGLRSFEVRRLFSAGEVIGEALVFGGDKQVVTLVAPADIDVLALRNPDARLTARIVYDGPIAAPIAKGAAIGRLEVLSGSTRMFEAPLETGEAVEQGSLHRRAFDAVYEWATSAVRQAFERLI
ncbi:D-alanyl-D-alanine carboxypeptidase family protein [Pseudochelatococcus contaminans]|uniref:serine-type D-Ala-D-Ala carboxypeptidase n=1 Tax=Pseudochelatococcus contaminans TaxID=1538103 RepID=A0A7W5Z147_9HYPH|nr:D-alanyl-D-alanine carboxypeptidase family protein [Pseudochelatococcus contaminans]MBB3808091.1 D-alanyl-D-alanine carboxypeptidase (penicillin-binding protein 5/6) [Pseudochelatococcus contaminans]